MPNSTIWCMFSFAQVCVRVNLSPGTCGKSKCGGDWVGPSRGCISPCVLLGWTCPASRSGTAWQDGFFPPQHRACAGCRGWGPAGSSGLSSGRQHGRTWHPGKETLPSPHCLLFRHHLQSTQIPSVSRAARSPRAVEGRAGTGQCSVRASPSPSSRKGFSLTSLTYLKGGCQEDGAKLFSVVSSDRTRGNGHKLKQKKLQLKMRKNFFTLRVTEPWHRLPREVVESPSLEIFQTRLDAVLCSLLWVTLLWQGLGWVTHRGPFQPLLFCDSVIPAEAGRDSEYGAG